MLPDPQVGLCTPAFDGIGVGFDKFQKRSHFIMASPVQMEMQAGVQLIWLNRKPPSQNLDVLSTLRNCL